jgi:hypothetical protein
MSTYTIYQIRKKKGFGGSEGFGQSVCVEVRCHRYYSCYLECYPLGFVLCVVGVYLLGSRPLDSGRGRKLLQLVPPLGMEEILEAPASR